MKKLLLLLAIPLFVGCSEEKYDPALDGAWVGEVSTLNGNSVGTDVIVFKFDKENLTTYKARKNFAKNEIEVEQGTYQNDEGKIVYIVQAHSCVDTESKLQSPRPLYRSMPYKIAEDKKSVEITVMFGTKIKLTKLSDSELDDLNHQAATASTGCFEGNSFAKEKIQKPSDVNSAQVELEKQLQDLERDQQEIEEIEE